MESGAEKVMILDVRTLEEYSLLPSDHAGGSPSPFRVRGSGKGQFPMKLFLISSLA